MNTYDVSPICKDVAENIHFYMSPRSAKPGVSSPAATRHSCAASCIAIEAAALRCYWAFLATSMPSVLETGAAVDLPAALPSGGRTRLGAWYQLLPIVDMSEKKDQEYFSDGLSEELIDLLSQVGQLHVPARTSSFSFKDKSATIGEIAKVLSVGHVLEGSVRRSGSHLRVTAQLVRADTGYHVWSETFDRSSSDIFALQDEIANAVVAALKIKLLPQQQPANQHRTENLEAYNEYLLGRELHDRDTSDASREAVAA